MAATIPCFVSLAVLVAAAVPLRAQTRGLDALRELRRRIDSHIETASLSSSLSPIIEAATGFGQRTIRGAVGPFASSLEEAQPSHGEGPRAQSGRDVQPREVVRITACRNGVPPDLAGAVIEHESVYRNDVVGGQGELGAAQILPATAATYGFDISRLRKDFAYNVEAGVQILRDLADRFQGDWRSVLRAYNGGPDFANSSLAARSKTAAYAKAVEARRNSYDSRCF